MCKYDCVNNFGNIPDDCLKVRSIVPTPSTAIKHLFGFILKLQLSSAARNGEIWSTHGSYSDVRLDESERLSDLPIVIS